MKKRSDVGRRRRAHPRAAKLFAHARRRKDLLPPPQRLREACETLLGYPNVVGCYVGLKWRRGRPTSTPCLVCVVSQKEPLRSLDRRHAIPAQLKWVWPGSSAREFRTDVQVLTRHVTPSAAVAGPGDDAQVPGNAGTIGIAIQHPVYGPVVTTDGHLLLAQPGVRWFEPGNRPTVRLANARGNGPSFTGLALKAVRIDRADYALLATVDLPAGNFYRDVTFLESIHVPIPTDLGRDLFVLSAAGVRKAKFIGVNGILPGSNGLTHRELILTDFVTEGGDSGACLVDSERRVWGLLIGGAIVNGQACSVFMSPLALMALEQATFLI